MDKNENISNDEIPEDFLDPQEFQAKYNTDYAQAHPESFLDTVSPENREIFSDFEILTGRNSNNRVNKFNTLGKKNKGKTYNTQKSQIEAEFKKWKDSALVEDAMFKIYNKMLSQALNGDFKQQQYLLDRIQGKMKEELDVKTEGEISFTLKPDENAINRQKKNKNDESD